MANRRVAMRRMAALSFALAITGALPTQVLAQEKKVIKVGTLKVIHGIGAYFYEQFAPPGYTIQVVPFETPTDGKNAVVTGSVDFGIFGIAAATLGAAAGEPIVVVAASCNRGMAVVSGAQSTINSIKDLRGKKVAILPGSTQEVVIMERLRMEGMSIKDIQPIRLTFSDMAPALARGDVDAYVGAEPGPGISLATGAGKIVEYPYTTPIGSLNMVLATRQEMVDKNPGLIGLMLETHRKANEFAMANRPKLAEMAIQKLGQKPESIDKAVPNVELTWKMDAKFITQAKYYGAEMLDKKQIRALPDYDKFINTKFVNALK
ncbi:MAG: NrtA/SsuA/CpmA family ABC transporter substrate-binding protein [Herminiimonas sp.]|nr:NrtA/SsuA/CpmA family ABC transporter substrate-binding protein [Herminiimonas sp.]